MDESNFHELADAVLASLMESIEMAEAEGVSVDFIEGVLTIEFDDGAEIVLNKHAPSVQIWMSSPISGASRFSYDQESDEWTNSSDEELKEKLADELAEIADIDISL